MNLVMCTDCGEFVLAKVEGDSTIPVADACPTCGGTTFVDGPTDESAEAD